MIWSCYCTLANYLHFDLTYIIINKTFILQYREMLLPQKLWKFIYPTLSYIMQNTTFLLFLSQKPCWSFNFISLSLLAEGTTNTWWILLHNDRESWHRRIKKQRRYEHLASQKGVFPKQDRVGRVGLEKFENSEKGWVLFICLHEWKKVHSFIWKSSVIMTSNVIIYIETLPAQKTSAFHSRHVTGHGS